MNSSSPRLIGPRATRLGKAQFFGARPVHCISCRPTDPSVFSPNFPQFPPFALDQTKYHTNFQNNKKPGSLMPPGFSYGRGDVIWTRDLLVPNQTRYQTALHLDGADKGTRTLDLMITNQPLYQLSYIGICWLVPARFNISYSEQKVNVNFEAVYLKLLFLNNFIVTACHYKSIYLNLNQ